MFSHDFLTLSYYYLIIIIIVIISVIIIVIIKLTPWYCVCGGQDTARCLCDESLLVYHCLVWCKCSDLGQGGVFLI